MYAVDTRQDVKVCMCVCVEGISGLVYIYFYIKWIFGIKYDIAGNSIYDLSVEFIF